VRILKMNGYLNNFHISGRNRYGSVVGNYAKEGGLEENAANGFGLRVYPNPAREWTAFDYVLPDADSKGSILITDVSGRLIQTIPVSGIQGQEVWDTREVKGGVYFFTLNAGGISKTGKIVVSK